MRRKEMEDDCLSIQWVNKKENKYIVKFDKIDFPIEMNDSYYKNVLKHLKN